MAQPTGAGHRFADLQLFLLTLERQADDKPTPRWITRWDAKAPPPQLMRLALSHPGADMPPVVYRASSKDSKEGKP